MPRPPSFDEEFAADWAVWVLENGLPDPPQTLGWDEAVPVARYVGPRMGGVMFLSWFGDPEDPEDEPYVGYDVEAWRRADGGWEEPNGSGGSNWHSDDDPFSRLPMPDREAWWGGRAGAAGDDFFAVTILGHTGVSGHAVVVEDRDGRNLWPINNSLGIALAAIDESRPATISIVTADGDVLATEKIAGDVFD